jgi:hypothetical protein
MWLRHRKSSLANPIGSTPLQGAGVTAHPLDFSLVQGGALFRIWRRLGLADDALELLGRRAIVMALLCWLPLLLLAAFEGKLLGGGTVVPFLLDLELHVKFLVAVPLLIYAERMAHRRIKYVARQFLDRNLIPEAGMVRFENAVASVNRLRDSVTAEALLLAVVYGIGILVVWRQYTALDALTWYATPAAGGSKLSLAGTWYGFVSLPIFQFLVLRWYLRMFIWARFLWQVSRIDLKLVPTHPDHVGGLGLLGCGVYAFYPLVAAHGVMLAGQIANRIFYLGSSLASFKLEIGMLVAFVLVLVLGPLLAFSYQLWIARLTGTREYDTLAQRYVREFDAKWMRGGAPAGEPLVGSSDIQSLADLGNSLQVVREMRTTIFTNISIIRLTIATLVPIVPLALTMMPLEDLLKKLFGILF